MNRSTLLIAAIVAAFSVVLNAQPNSRLQEHKYATLVIRTLPDVGSFNVWLSKPFNRNITTTSNSVTIDSLEPVTYSVIAYQGKLQGVASVSMKPGLSQISYVQLWVRDTSATTIVGRLLEPVSKEPVGNIQIESSSGSISTTDEDGNFYFLNHPRGTYSFSVKRIDETKQRRWFNLTEATESVSLQFTESEWTLDSNMVAYYPLDNGSVVDVSGSETNGSVFGAVAVQDRNGAKNTALGFGKWNRAEIPDAEWQHKLPISISFWMKVESTTPDTTFILSKYLHPSGEGWSIFIENKRLCAGYFRNGFTTWSRVNIDGEIRDGKWRHYVVTVDSYRLVLYVDRARIPASPFQSNIEPTTSTAPIYLGTVASVYPQRAPYHIGFDGAIDDLIFYNRVLTEKEIIELVK
ncbi:MAG: LamG domain-containing protein [Ignavibacteria bacterium]|nr:LamG domain-containing protein [Ignavibacteria bacterium]